jgi:hypothetical protein
MQTLTHQRRGFAWLRHFTVVLSAFTFLVLVSVAATHLHFGPDGDEGCAVCAAVIGKLEGPSSPPVLVPPASVAYAWQPPHSAPQIACAAIVVLPPSCGPPFTLA